MYLSPDEARSDVILTGATLVFGGVLLGLLLTAPGVPSSGVGGLVIEQLSWFALSGLVPFLLARYRDDVPGAFGLGGGRSVPWGPALTLAAPVAVFGLLRGVLVDGDLVTAVLGRPGRPALGSPVVGPGGTDLVAVAFELTAVVVLTIGAVLLLGFLIVRGRDAFREDDRSSTEVLRTFGAVCVGVAFVLGGLRSLVAGGGFVVVLLNVVALVAVLLVADRLVPADARLTRPAVLTPVALLLVAHVLAAGGLFRGDLLLGLTTGALAAGIAVAVAVVAEHRGTVAIALPLLVAVHWWPTCLSPLPFVRC